MPNAMPELAVDPHDHRTLAVLEDALGVRCFCAQHPEQMPVCPVHNGRYIEEVPAAIEARKLAKESEELKDARENIAALKTALHTILLHLDPKVRHVRAARKEAREALQDILNVSC